MSNYRQIPCAACDDAEMCCVEQKCADDGLRSNGFPGIGRRATICDEPAKSELAAFKAELRADKAALLEWYVKNGVLAADGRLTGRYGGAGCRIPQYSR